MAPSALPHNGVDWDTTESWRMEGPKNRWGLEMASLIHEQMTEAIETGKIRISSKWIEFLEIEVGISVVVHT